MRPDFQSLDDLAKRLADVVPEQLKTAPAEIEKRFRVILETTLSKMDVVTREEFEAQKKVLARAEEKLSSLEAALKEKSNP